MRHDSVVSLALVYIVFHIVLVPVLVRILDAGMIKLYILFITQK